MKWTAGRHYHDLTIVVVGHNLLSLHYPFVESFMSAIPLGCRFLYGDFSSTDKTLGAIHRLHKYAPIEIIQLPWQAYKGGQAIGEATQDLIDRSPTPFVWNLQACEILDIDVAQTIQNKEKLTAMWCDFHHIWGTFKFDGREEGRAYGAAPRMFHKDYAELRCTDGCFPPHWPGPIIEGGWERAGTVFRYSYLWDNQVREKALSHYKLYGSDVQTPAVRTESINWCKSNENYFGPHPEFVQHLIGRSNYDFEFSMAVLEQKLGPKA